MSTFKLRLVRPGKHIVLQLTEGALLSKGQWVVVASDPKSSLQASAGAWENWILGDPGGDRNIRLYDSSDTKVALLKEYVEGNGNGKAEILLPGFGKTFGDEPFEWFRSL